MWGCGQICSFCCWGGPGSDVPDMRQEVGPYSISAAAADPVCHWAQVWGKGYISVLGLTSVAIADWAHWSWVGLWSGSPIEICGRLSLSWSFHWKEQIFLLVCFVSSLYCFQGKPRWCPVWNLWEMKTQGAQSRDAIIGFTFLRVLSPFMIICRIIYRIPWCI